MDLEKVTENDICGMLSKALLHRLRERGTEPEEKNEGVVVEFKEAKFIVFRVGEQIKIQYVESDELTDGTTVWLNAPEEVQNEQN